MAVAAHFGLTAAEVRMKANYGVPEIWFVEEDRAALEDTAAALSKAGLNTALVDGGDLVDVPPQIPATAVTFEDDGLRVVSDGSESIVSYDSAVLGVFGRPQPSDGLAQRTGSLLRSQMTSGGRLRRRNPSLAAESTEEEFAAFLELYLPSDAGPLRHSIVKGVTEISGVPQDVAGPSGLSSVLQECEARFAKAYFDKRLIDMKLRRGVQMVAPGGAPRRAGFSFATTALNELLRSLAAALQEASQADLSSRLVYLTGRSRIS
jgi:hypothetical protein